MGITGYENLKNLAVSHVISFVFGATYSAFDVGKNHLFILAVSRNDLRLKKIAKNGHVHNP